MLYELGGLTSMLRIRNKDDTSSFLPLIFTFLISLLTFALLIIPSARVEGLLPGSLDQTFGSGGKVTTDFSGNWDQIAAIALQSDGRILAAGTSAPDSGNSKAILARYNSDGTPDASFGAAGVVVTTVMTRCGLTDVVMQPDGKIIAAGYANDLYPPDYFVVIRYNPDGSLDNTFGNAGIFSISPANYAFPAAVVVQSDGRIVVGGHSNRGSANDVFTIMRLTSSGGLDTSFHDDGFVTTQFGTVDFLNDIAIQPADGKIVAVGANDLNPSGDPDFAIARYFPNGVLDTSFDGDGKVTTKIAVGYDGAFEVLIQPDGKLVVAGQGRKDPNNNQFEVARYNTNGSLDTTFSGDGKAAVALSTTNSEAYSAVLQRDGKIVLGGHGWVGAGTGSYMAFARFTNDGQLDTTFDSDGKLTIDFASGSTSSSLALQPDGRIVAGGTVTAGTASDFAMARFIGGIPGVADFDGDGKTDLSVFRESTSEWWYLKSGDSQPVTASFGQQGDIPIPADYDNDGKTDLAVWRAGTLGYAYILQSSNGTVRPEQFGETGDLPIVGDWDADGKPDLAVYRDSAFGTQSYFFYRGSLNNAAGNTTYVPWGTAGDRAMRGDYDGDGRLDAAVFRPSNATWYILQSANGTYRYLSWGIPTDRFVPADYDGDGKTDFAVFREGTWYVLQSSNAIPRYVQFGVATDILVPADYNGDLAAEPAVYRGGDWYVLAPDGSVQISHFGLNTDAPVMRAYLP